MHSNALDGKVEWASGVSLPHGLSLFLPLLLIPHLLFLKTLMMEILKNIGSGLRSGVLFTRCCGMYTHSNEGLISLLSTRKRTMCKINP